MCGDYLINHYSRIHFFPNQDDSWKVRPGVFFRGSSGVLLEDLSTEVL